MLSPMVSVPITSPARSLPTVGGILRRGSQGWLRGQFQEGPAAVGDPRQDGRAAAPPSRQVRLPHQPAR